MRNFIPLLVLAVVSAAPLAAAPTKGAEPVRISHGETVNLADFVVPGKTTVFDFTSEYCPPCRGYDQPLVLLHQKNPDIAVVKVDINRPGVNKIDWQSPVAQQFELHSIPHFKVYGPDGKLRAEDKMVVGPDGHIDRAASSSAARKFVDDRISRTTQ
jgi:thiol-disulfide isomerase/thioredoxin